jgi:hypothetical protein
MVARRWPAKEHAAHLKIPLPFGRLRRKDDFLDEGVAAVFCIVDGEADLQALLFRSDRFTPEQARRWLRDRGLNPVLFTRASGRRLARQRA